MIIILEGPDGAGKTTLAKKLHTQWGSAGYPTTLLHRGPLDNDPMIEYVLPLQAMRENDHVFILDRWHVGELFYGPLLRGSSKIDITQAMYIEMVIQTMGAHFFHVTAPLNILHNRYDQEPDSLIKKEWIINLAVSYDVYEVKNPHWVPPFGGTNEFRSMSPMAGHYIGPKNPRVLLIGDVRGHDEFIFPFVPRPDTSGYWLMRSLQYVGAPVMEIGIVNGNELSTDQLRSLWNNLGSPPVITLGNNANRAWRRLQIDSGHQIPHPQYMRRFKNKDLESYGILIMAAMKG